MTTSYPEISAFNKGLISPLGIARTDLKRTPLSAEVHVNWLPRILGSMSLRPGLEYIGNTRNNSKALHLPFIFSSTDKAALEFTNSAMRIRIDDAIASRPSVATSIPDSDFSSYAWASYDESGATSFISGGECYLKGTGVNIARRTQTFTVTSGDANKEHGLLVQITFGEVEVRVGTTPYSGELLAATNLGIGYHNLTFTPPSSGTYYVNVANRNNYTSSLTYCGIAPAGDIVLTTPWAESDLPFLRFDQSANTIFVACKGKPPYKIERRGVNSESWSVVRYETQDGPFLVENTSAVKLSASALSGGITLTSSLAFFTAQHVGALFSITSIGQRVENEFNAPNQNGGSIRVTGTGSARSFSLTVGGTFTGTMYLQRSVSDEDNYVNTGNYYSSAGTVTVSDGLDNQIVYYRLVTDSAAFTGAATTTLTYSQGSKTGIVRVKSYFSSTAVQAEVLKPLGGTGATATWSEGAWSEKQGYPSSVALHEGRLGWAGKNKIWLSASDIYNSFDINLEGDSAPIIRTIGSGPMDDVKWLLPLLRLVVGTDSAEWVIRSSSFDEPITAANFNSKAPDTQGAASISPLKIDTRGLFVQKSGARVFQLEFNAEGALDYRAVDTTAICPEVTEVGVVKMVVQRQPDTRVHCIRTDGKVALLVNDPIENALCWVVLETDGVIEDAYVLPNTTEDHVYYVVRRVINGNTVRYVERFALEKDCRGGDLNKQMDSFKTYASVGSATLTGLSHLAGKTVVVWADGKDFGSYVVSLAGEIVLPSSVTNAVVGLPYSAEYYSSKILGMQYEGIDIPEIKRISKISFVLYKTHYQGLRYGTSLEKDGLGNYTKLDNLPLVHEGAPVPPDTIYETLTTRPIVFSGEFTTDARIALVASSPRPCTILAAIMGMTTDDTP